MKTVVTGAKGFIGRNLVVALRRAGMDVAEIDVDSPPDAMRSAIAGAGVVFHLAGVNRPERDEEFVTGNVGTLESVLGILDGPAADGGRAAKPLIVLSSSTQAGRDNPYGRSKLAAENALEEYAARTGTPAAIYRLPGVFGKWCRPDYNSVVATFCHRIARDQPISVWDPARVVELVYIDDVVVQFMTHLETRAEGVARGVVEPVFAIALGELADLIRGFRAMRSTHVVPDTSDPLTRRVLGTYTSYLPPPDLAYPLEQRTDPRGTLVELLRSAHGGQIFLSRTNPGFTRGEHYHDTKVEKFCVLAGDAVIRFRSVLGGDVIEHRVSGADFKVVDIPPGMTHSIENVGTTEMIVLFWASEVFDPHRPDTHSLKVLSD